MAGIRPSDLQIRCPAELKNTHWQKAKGKVGKLIKTGLGAELKKLETMLKKVDMAVLDPASSPSKTLEELAKKIIAAKKEYASKVEPLRKQLTVIRTKSESAEKKLKSTPMGAKAAKAAGAVGKAAALYSVTCKSLDMIGSVEKVKADIAKKNALAAKLMNSALAKFIAGAKVFLADPTEASWGKNIKQQGRSVSNSLAQLQNYRAKFWKNFEKFKGFDTGPANCLMDLWIQEHKNESFDRGGQWAKSGNLDKNLLERMLKDDYFSKTAPKSTGREYFNKKWLMEMIGESPIKAVDVQCTLAHLSVHSIKMGLAQLPEVPQLIIICGGGSHNHYVFSLIEHLCQIKCKSSLSFGYHPDYIEAMLFAWLAYQYDQKNSIDMRSITGSHSPLIYGVKWYNEVVRE
ncbi:MAG: anhydro-N-acetylmuramic acid kinase [Rhodobacteraceae bacterium]|nr:anhydro-N-acetylmuramic acid kinase [Paracoccaceae bacterium]